MRGLSWCSHPPLIRFAEADLDDKTHRAHGGVRHRCLRGRSLLAASATHVVEATAPRAEEEFAEGDDDAGLDNTNERDDDVDRGDDRGQRGCRRVTGKGWGGLCSPLMPPLTYGREDVVVRDPRMRVSPTFDHDGSSSE